MATTTKSRKGKGNVDSNVASTFLRVVHIDGVNKGVFPFPVGTNAHQMVRQKLIERYGEEEARKHTIVIARLPEEGSTMPLHFKRGETVAKSEQVKLNKKDTKTDTKTATKTASSDAE